MTKPIVYPVSVKISFNKFRTINPDSNDNAIRLLQSTYNRGTKMRYKTDSSDLNFTTIGTSISNTVGSPRVIRNPRITKESFSKVF